MRRGGGQSVRRRETQQLGLQWRGLSVRCSPARRCIGRGYLGSMLLSGFHQKLDLARLRILGSSVVAVRQSRGWAHSRAGKKSAAPSRPGVATSAAENTTLSNCGGEASFGSSGSVPCLTRLVCSSGCRRCVAARLTIDWAEEGAHRLFWDLLGGACTCFTGQTSPHRMFGRSVWDF